MDHVKDLVWIWSPLDFERPETVIRNILVEWSFRRWTNSYCCSAYHRNGCVRNFSTSYFLPLKYSPIIIGNWENIWGGLIFVSCGSVLSFIFYHMKCQFVAEPMQLAENEIVIRNAVGETVILRWIKSYRGVWVILYNLYFIKYSV